MRTSALLKAATIAATLAGPWSALPAQQPQRADRPALPRYSQEPATPNEPLSLGVLVEVLKWTALRRRPIVLLPYAGGPRPAPSVAQIPSSTEWPDWLAHDVQEALTDPAFASSATVAQAEPAARQLGIAVVPVPERLVVADSAPVVLYLSQPGFNRDSTIAAVQVTTECGAVCGSEIIWLLSRRPGYQMAVLVPTGALSIVTSRCPLMRTATDLLRRLRATT